MIHIKRISSLLVAVLAVSVLATSSTTALAHGGDDDSSNSSSSTSSSETYSQETEHTTSAQKKAEYRQKASDEVNKRINENKATQAKNKQQRHDRCESHKKGLNTKFDRIVTHSQKVQTRIDNILNKVTAYKTESNLTPAGWDDLLAAAQAAQTASSQSITDLQNVTPTIDCNSDTVATDVATFKAAATTSRDNLKAYKTSVKALITALKDAKPASSQEGSN